MSQETTQDPQSSVVVLILRRERNVHFAKPPKAEHPSSSFHGIKVSLVSNTCSQNRSLYNPFTLKPPPEPWCPSSSQISRDHHSPTFPCSRRDFNNHSRQKVQVCIPGTLLRRREEEKERPAQREEKERGKSCESQALKKYCWLHPRSAYSLFPSSYTHLSQVLKFHPPFSSTPLSITISLFHSTFCIPLLSHSSHNTSATFLSHKEGRGRTKSLWVPLDYFTRP